MSLTVLRSTYGSEQDAKAAARDLVAKRLAACVHVQPIWSTYRWKGKVEDEDEWLLEAKARQEDRDAVWSALLDGHPYETPCVEVVGEVTVPAPYLRWAGRVTRRD